MLINHATLIWVTGVQYLDGNATTQAYKIPWHIFWLVLFISGANLIMNRMSIQDEQDNKGKTDVPLLTDPPFYLPEFEKSYRYIIDEYEVPPKEIAIFMPCSVKKPYSSSPSHQLIRMIISQVLDPSLYHIVIFGTCGIVPAELETMYPYANYKYMLGRCNDEKIKDDFLRIETDRVAGYLNKTKGVYKYRIGYCIGLFREALVRGSEKAGVPIDLLLPTRDIINKVIEEGDCTFQEGSLSMEEYLGEFCDALIKFRNERIGRS